MPKEVIKLAEESSGDRATRFHNLGEQDGEENVTDHSPSSLVNQFFFGYSDQDIADIESYKEGFENGYKQRS